MCGAGTATAKTNTGDGTVTSKQVVVCPATVCLCPSWLIVACPQFCRFVRLGTASLAAAAEGGPFIVAEKLDLRKYAARPHLARVLCDYILYVVSIRSMLGVTKVTWQVTVTSNVPMSTAADAVHCSRFSYVPTMGLCHCFVLHSLEQLARRQAAQSAAPAGPQYAEGPRACCLCHHRVWLH